jgi:hypothetical protein
MFLLLLMRRLKKRWLSLSRDKGSWEIGDFGLCQEIITLVDCSVVFLKGFVNIQKGDLPFH